MAFVALAALSPLIVTTINVKIAFAAVAGVVFSYALATIRDEVLPFVVLLALAMGSCFRLDIVQMSFYIRFFVLGVIALKSVWTFVRGEADADPMGRRWSLFHGLFLYVAIYGMVGSLYSVDASLSFQRAASFLLLFLAIGHFFWTRIRTEAQVVEVMESIWKTVVVIMVASAILVVLFPGQMRYGGRWRLVFFSPNQLGHFASMLAPVVAWHYFERGSKRLSIACLLFVGAALLGSGSRSAILGAFLGLGVLFVLCYRKQATYLFGVLTLILAASLIFKLEAPDPNRPDSFIQEHVVRGYSLQTGSGRTGVWKSAWSLISKRPVFGYGFGITDKLFRMRMFDDLPLEFQGGHTHNSYIEELVNLGFLGGGAFFLMIGYLFLTGVRGIVGGFSESRDRRVLFVAIFSSILSGIDSSLFESWFTSVGSFFCFPFWMLGMLLIRLDRIPRQSREIGA